MKTLLFIAWLGSFNADGITTAKAMNQGGIERNNILMTQSAKANFIILESEAVSGLALYNHYYAKHPKLVRVMLLTGIAIEGMSAYHNINTLQTQARMRR